MGVRCPGDFGVADVLAGHTLPIFVDDPREVVRFAQAAADGDEDFSKMIEVAEGVPRLKIGGVRDGQRNSVFPGQVE